MEKPKNPGVLGGEHSRSFTTNSKQEKEVLGKSCFSFHHQQLTTVSFAGTEPCFHPGGVQETNFVSLYTPETIWGLQCSLSCIWSCTSLDPHSIWSGFLYILAILNTTKACLFCGQGGARCSLLVILPHLVVQHFWTALGQDLFLSKVKQLHVQNKTKLMCSYFASAELQFWAIILICVFALLGFILLLLLCFLVSCPFALIPHFWL